MATVPLGPKHPPALRLRGRTILIVEDEPLVALHLHASLHDAGAGLIAATSADEALRLIQRNDVSAAILDVLG
jgi:DNA-binding response OmpR family regulator